MSFVTLAGTLKVLAVLELIALAGLFAVAWHEVCYPLLKAGARKTPWFT